MIPHTDLQWQTSDWQQELRDAIRDPGLLLDQLGLDRTALAEQLSAAKHFPMLVPRPFVRKMKAGDPCDPLLLQALPAPEELHSPSGYSADPLQESHANPAPGLIHKYHGRVLLIAAPGCAINCRYCFRRHFDYSANNPSRRDWADTLRYIAEDSSISEVILSGGDPLLLTDAYLQGLITQIGEINHVQRLRIHSRLPVVLPSRITDTLCQMLSRTRLKPVLVIHCNHANEIDDELTEALSRLSASGVTLLNQSVLLRKVNDSPLQLAELSIALFDAGVMPYYLHLLDPVIGAAHFDLPQDHALEIYEQLMGLVPGYLLPKLVRETPEQPSKTPVIPPMGQC